MSNKFLVLLGTLALCSQAWSDEAISLLTMKNFNSVETEEAPREIVKQVEVIFDKLASSTKTLSSSATPPPVDIKVKSSNIWKQEGEIMYNNRKTAELALLAATTLCGKNESMSYNIQNGQYKIPVPGKYCPKTVYRCNQYERWRSIDGSCNNLRNPSWGEARKPFKRLAPAIYDDYIQTQRTKSVVPGQWLPNSRMLAMNCFRPQQSISEWSHFFIWFAQFVDHDVSLTEQVGYPDGYRKFCPCGTSDPDCWNIPIPYGDKVNQDQQCIQFVRSSPALDCSTCYLGQRQQVNGQTAYVDLSQVYGTTPELSRLLRSFVGGQLKTQTKYGKTILPSLPFTACNYDIRAPDYSRRPKCYMAGDYRAEDNVFLTSLHTAFVMDHNYLAQGLAQQNPYWDDERLFQETRRILIAVFQHIVYDEFLPALLGKDLARSYELVSRADSSYFKYNPNINAQTYNEFSAAVFRFGHTLMTYTQHSADASYKVSSHVINNYLFNNQRYENYKEDAIRGSLMSSSYYPQSQLNVYVNDYLFQGLFYKEGKRASLAALNIWRGRDHGIPTYNTLRRICGLKPAYSFKDFVNVPEYVVELWASNYASYEDVDAFVGIFGEYPLEGSVYGPTGACIVARQFYDWKYGDRWWFETSDPWIRFNEQQLASIKKVTLARILCNTMGLSSVQRWVFFGANYDWNPLVSCSSVPGIDLTLWRETPTYNGKYQSYAPPPAYGPPTYPQSYNPPSYPQPAPAYSAPPSYPQPAPAYSAPPSYPQPAPAYSAPPSYPQPAPAYSAPPSYSQPAQAY